MSAEVVFIGLGNMGLPMATNLVRGGLTVMGFDLVAENVSKLVAEGGVQGASLADAVRQAKVVCTMLPASQHVQGVYLGEDGVFAHARPGTLLIDSSTIAPDVARQLGQLAAERGLEMIDAPVSGGPVGAKAGTLTFMVGGTAKGFDRHGRGTATGHGQRSGPQGAYRDHQQELGKQLGAQQLQPMPRRDARRTGVKRLRGRLWRGPDAQGSRPGG